MDFFSKTEDSKIFGVIDIGSGSVAGAFGKRDLCHVDSKPEIIFSIRIPVSYGEKGISDKNTELSLTKSLQRVIHEMEKFSKSHNNVAMRPEKILCFMSSPWAYGFTCEVSIKDDKIFTVSDSVVKKALISGREIALSGKGDNKDVVIIDEKIQKTFLNGYHVHDFFLKKTNNFSSWIKYTFSDKSLHQKISECIRSIWPDSLVEFGSSSTATYFAMERLFPNMDEYIFSDIASQITEISIVQNGILKNTISFPHGRNFLIKKFAERLHVVPAVMESYLRIYAKGHADQNLSKKINDCIGEVKVEWLESFHKAMPLLSENIILPKNFLILAGPDLGPFFTSLLEKEKYSELPFAQEFKITVLDKEHMLDFVSLSPGVRPDPAIIVASIMVTV